MPANQVEEKVAPTATTGVVPMVADEKQPLDESTSELLNQIRSSYVDVVVAP